MKPNSKAKPIRIGPAMRGSNQAIREKNNGSTQFNKLRNQLVTAPTPPVQQGTLGQTGLQKVNSTQPNSSPLKPEQNVPAPAQSPAQPTIVGQQAEQPRAIGPAQQEQAVKNQLMPPAGQPPQDAAAPAQDNSGIDQQIAELQKQIADLQAQKK